MRIITKFINPSTLLGCLFAVSLLSAPSVFASGKAEAAKEALAAAVELGPKLHELITGYDRSAEIVIRNHSDHALTNIRTYADSGKVLGLDKGKIIPAKGAGGVSARKSDGTATGAVGLVSWAVEGTGGHRFVLMYSVPFDYNLYDNWFNVTMLQEGGFKIDEELFDKMYDDWDPKRAGSQEDFLPSVTKFVGGAPSMTVYNVSGTMEDSGNTKIVIDFYGPAN